MTQAKDYSMQLWWSEKDEAYLVTLAEWKGYLSSWRTATHGDPVEESARNGREVLEMLIEVARDHGEQPLASQSRGRPKQTHPAEGRNGPSSNAITPALLAGYTESNSEK